MEIRPVGAEMFHAGGRTDMTKLTAAFRNFANASKVTNRKCTSTLHTTYKCSLTANSYNEPQSE
jgi:hypothetical protein